MRDDECSEAPCEQPAKKLLKTHHSASVSAAVLLMPEDILITVLQYLRAKEMAHCEQLCQFLRSKRAKSTSLTIMEHAAMLRCNINGWQRLSSGVGWKQTLYEQRVWIVVDTSASMGEIFRDRNSRQSISRLDIAVKHLKKKILPTLKPEQEFNLVRFSRSIHAEGTQSANADNIAEAMEKLNEWRPDGSTEIYSALHEAYNDPKTKEVYLISDGDARDHAELISATRRWCCLNTDQDCPESDEEGLDNEHAKITTFRDNGSLILEASDGLPHTDHPTISADSAPKKGINQENDVTRTIPCHTICVFSDGRSKDLMRTLSRVTGGSCVNYAADRETYSRVY